MPRVYIRKFDWEEAKRLYADGWRISALAERYGVSFNAVGRVVDERYKKTERSARKAYHERHRTQCEICGDSVLARTHAAKRKVGPYIDGRELCIRCRADERTERLRFNDVRVLVAVRCSNLDCANGERWQPPSNFTRGHRFRHIREGGIHSQCRACQTRARRKYRATHPEVTAEENRRAREARKNVSVS